MEVGELLAQDDVVTKEGLSDKGKTGKANEVLAISRKRDEEGIVTNKPRVTYSKEELLNLRESPASKLWPSVFSDEYVRHGIWDPEAWHQSYSSEKRCASPGEELKKQFVIEDGIVLSPQRQSFGQGCHIPQSAPERLLLQERGKPGLSRTTDREREGRSRLTGRVGRGRTLDFKERAPLQERNKDSDEPSGKYAGTRDREREEKADRDRGYGKDKERGFREREKERKRSREEPARGRNIQVRKRQARDAYEEPEWFTFGPSSQFETMELKGFDDVEDLKKDRERRKSASDEIKAILSVGKDGPMNGEKKASSPQTGSGLSNKSATDKKTEAKSTDDNKQTAKPFDINDFFLSDTVLPFPGGGVDQASSRFCQFFGRPGSNYSSSRSGSAGLSSGGANTPRTPSPAPNYLFTPITPSAEDCIESHGLATMLQKSQISVQPLLDEVMSSGKEGKVMGSVRLEDIEADVQQASKSSVKKEIIDMAMEHNKENISQGSEMSNTPVQMVAFNRLVEKMKSSGTLPEKPQPAISGLPTRLLPRPPSPKRKTPRNSPSPLLDLRRSPSPTELLKQMTMTAPLSDPRPPSPAQVVPQMNRPPSPLEMFHKFNSVVTSPQDLFASPLLRRSPSPLAMLAQQRQSPSPPLGFGTVNIQMVPHQVPPLYQSRPQPGSIPHRANQQMMRKQQERHVTPGGPPKQRTHTAVHPKPVSSQSGSPHITDRSFMPTSVMRKIHQDRMDQKTPKSEEKTQTQDQSKEKNVEAEVQHTTVNRKDVSALGTTPRQPFTDQDSSQLMASAQGAGDLIKGVLFQQHPDEKQASSQANAIKHDHLLSPKSMRSGEAHFTQDGSPVLQKPTAFKPLPGSPQVPFSSLKGGVNSEPAFPLHLFNQNVGSPSRPSKALPNSAPCTPQRHPLIDKATLLSPQQLVSKGMMSRDDGNKPLVGLFGHNGSMESQAKGVRDGITRVVAANEGRPLTHSCEQHAHTSAEQVSAFEDTFRGKRSGLSGSHPTSHHSPNNMGDQRINSNEVTAHQEGLPPNHPVHRIHGGETRPTPVHHVPRQFHGAHGPRPAPHLLNGRLSPSSIPVMHGHPGRTPFNSPMPGMPPRSAMHPGMMPPHMHPAYLRMMSSAGSPMGMPSPGMSPASMRMQMPHSAGRYPVMPGHHPAMMYGGRPSLGYPPVNPAVAAAMMGARSSHIPPQTGLQQGRRVASPVMNHPPQSQSPGGGGNILSKWFSEDVLQQLHPGQRSVTPDYSRKFVSVEELERQQAAAFN